MKLALFVTLQSNLSNPPTPPSSLPPTPPPSVQHKLLNGVTPGEELSGGQKDTESSEEPMGKLGIWHKVQPGFLVTFNLLLNINYSQCNLFSLQSLLQRR